ncbi:phenylalanine racemase [Bacillus sp. FSL K6-3431]|uniref:phenylalanine racemase n=1 Tax=Bacillus sp. FSL K6-3431 TaxID=2921500 RepID=UPI0030FA19FB
MNEEAKDYASARDFAFFVVNFGYSKRDYGELTELEKAFIYKAYETKLINDTTYARDAQYNALINANRKKNKKFIEMFKPKQKKADVEYNKDAVSTIIDVEKKEGKSWVDKLYAGIGRKRPAKKGG